MDLVLIFLGAAYGGLAGLFLSRPAYRLSVEAAESRRDHCPRGHEIAGPAGGWLGLARCDGNTPPADGGASDSGPCRYGPGRPAAPVVCALVCAALAATTGARPELVVWLVLTPLAILLALVDLTVHRLPDVLTLPLAGVMVGLLGAAALLPGSHGSWTTAVAGSLALTAVYFVLFLISPSGMGLGDVKLALSLGAVLGWYGWPVLALGTLLAFGCGALYAGALLVLRRANRRSAMAFGPFMLLGALAGVLFGGV
ncbi:prepilin peptidase [Streptomyces chattanoogensis]|uniref:prepilin peptidase n=1 Tax=Streptomyces chattanoogensis TaxID=66876 RepID=UPI00062CB8DE